MEDRDGVNLRAAVVGASGYVGGELLRLLGQHPVYEIGVIAGAGSAGRNVGDYHPHLAQFNARDDGIDNKPATAYEIEAVVPERLADHDVVFLAVPHGQSVDIAHALCDDVLVVDCGADFRLEDARAWAKFYGGPHNGSWVYGLPELSGAREQLQTTRRIAAPGCYPTAVTLALMPALAAKLIEPLVTVVAVSGTTGAGRSPLPHLLASEVLGSMSAYGAGGSHRHTPEIEQNLQRVYGGPVCVSFTPLLAPMKRGIIAVCSAAISSGVDTETLRDIFREWYSTEPFVTLLPFGKWPTTAGVTGSNNAHVQVAFDEHAQRVVAVAAIDNLTKGAAGSAIQSANIALGLPETIGLPRNGAML